MYLNIHLALNPYRVRLQWHECDQRSTLVFLKKCQNLKAQHHDGCNKQQTPARLANPLFWGHDPLKAMRGCITTEVFGQRRESIHTLLLLFRFHPPLLIHACFRLFHSFLLKTSLFKVTLKKILFSRGYFESAIPRSLMIPYKITLLSKVIRAII